MKDKTRNEINFLSSRAFIPLYSLLGFRYYAPTLEFEFVFILSILLRMISFSSAWTRSTASLTLAILLTGLGFPASTSAQQYIPPNRGLPGRREGGGTRGGCVTTQPTLTAFIPETHYGTTTRAYPSFFWYLPQTTAEFAEFILLNAEDEEVYSTTFPLTGTEGIVRLDLPATEDQPALEVGQDYHWYFALVCDAVDRSGDILTEGWIQRIEPDAALTTQLEQSADREHPALYAQSGIWYDALATLADLRQSPSDAAVFQTQWNNLLESVGLESFSDAPIGFDPEPEPDLTTSPDSE